MSSHEYSLTVESGLIQARVEAIENRPTRPWLLVVEDVLQVSRLADTIDAAEVDGLRISLLNESEPFSVRAEYLIYMADAAITHIRNRSQ